MRLAALSIVVVACLAAASPAAAHSRAPTVALDYRLRLAATALPGVHADVVDGERSLRLRVDGPHTLVVRGLRGEPVLRFTPSGVWVNLASPTAAADRIAKRGSLGVFRRGGVVSSLPASVTRLATAVALVGGAFAVVLSARRVRG